MRAPVFTFPCAKILKYHLAVKRLLFIVFGICFLLVKTNGQDQKVVDSLILVLQDRIGGMRYPPLYELTFEYIDKDNKKALEIIQQAEEAASLSGDSLWIVKSKRVKSQILLKLEKIQESIQLCEGILGIAQRNKFASESVIIVNNLGTSYLFHGKYDMALQYHFKTYELAKQTQDLSFIAMGLHNIGIDYYKIKNYKKSLYYLKRSLEIQRADHAIAYNTLMNVSLCYTNQKDFTNARIYVRKSLNECLPGCPAESMMHIKYAMGCIDFGLKEYGKAEDEFLTSYSFSKELNNPRMQFDNIYFLAEIYIMQGSIKKVAYYLGEAQKLITQTAPFPMEILKIYSRLYEMHSYLHNFEKVAHYQGKYIKLKDSIYNEALTTNLMKIESDFQERANIEKIAEQNEVLVLKEEIIYRQWVLNIVTGFLGFTTLALLIFVFRSYRQKMNLNVILDKKIAERTRQLELSRDELLKAFRERDILITRASDDINETLSTIRGLCLTGAKDISDPAALLYMEEIDKTSHHLTRNLKSLFQNRMGVQAI